MKKFARSILKWQQTHGRHDLPWQNGRDPYRIWISEVMLQQTQVNAVIGYFERFMHRFPNVTTLASANIDEVMPYWAGLGYYARARNIHKSAGIITTNFDGQFPRQYESVLALPGVGRSTASAICAFAYGAPIPILDGNVKRVFARFFGMARRPYFQSRVLAPMPSVGLGMCELPLRAGPLDIPPVELPRAALCT